MAHRECFEFVAHVAKLFPQYFYQKAVLEVGSLNINGSVRQFFRECDYLGVDIGKGEGVDLVIDPKQPMLPFHTGVADVVISTEMFEHNPYWEHTFRDMIRLLRPGGMLLFTCATEGRAVHGTIDEMPEASPITSSIEGFKNYYRNLREIDFENTVEMHKEFSPFTFLVNNASHDLYFLGFKSR